ncbi:transposable element Tcb2 transposase [Trichonephila clavipes]|nr:transposable element Tcb2 transposase [Trichonephila clavipes]
MGKKGDLSPCKKSEVKALVNAKLFSNREISRRLKVSEASVRRIKKKIESGEELSPKRKKKCSRKPIFTPRPAAPPESLCLTPAMKAKRLNWAKQWRDADVDFWRSVCFSYESTFEILQNKAQFMRRRRRGEKFHSDCVVQTVKHPTKIKIWSVISGKGTGRLDVVKGMMRQDQYKDVLQNRLIPQLEEWFPNGESYIFMQGGAPCHTDRSIKAFLAEQNILLLDLPGNSPDMNTIENIWELMKREVAKDVITNKTQLLEKIIHVWNHPPQILDTVQSCIDSMPRRIEALIAAEGGTTKY